MDCKSTSRRNGNGRGFVEVNRGTSYAYFEPFCRSYVVLKHSHDVVATSMNHLPARRCQAAIANGRIDRKKVTVLELEME